MIGYRILPKAADPVITIKLPAELLAALQSEASASDRGINLEVVFRLAKSLEKESENMSMDALFKAIFKTDK